MPITLVLFLLGLFGIMLMNVQQLSKAAKENIGFSIMLKADANEGAIHRFQKDLDASRSIKSTSFISKEQVAEDLKEER